MANEFSNAFKKISKAFQTSQTQALNKAANSTKTLYAKEVSKELGIASGKIKKRAKVVKATNQNQGVTLSIGVRVLLAAQDLKPGKFKVQTAIGARYAANYTVKGSKKAAEKGAFLANVNNSSSTKKLVLQRVGGEQYPTKTVLVNELIPAVEAIVPELQKHMADKFEEVLISQLKFNLQK